MKTLTNNLRLFWQGALLSYVALFHWMRPIQYAASKILMPLAQMFFFVYLGTYATSADNRSFYIIGNAIQIAAVSGIFGTWEDRLIERAVPPDSSFKKRMGFRALP